jgi:hypothetical protein
MKENRARGNAWQKSKKAFQFNSPRSALLPMVLLGAV